MSGDRPRYIVWIPSPPAQETAPAPDARRDDVGATGDSRALQELAVAIAATGRHVEMRGCVDQAELQALAGGAGVESPELAREPDRAGPGDVMIMPASQHNELCALLADSEQRLGRVPELERHISDLSRELDDVRADARAAREETRQLDERLMQSQRVYAAMINSRSWRLTKPLRRARRRLNRGLSQVSARREL